MRSEVGRRVFAFIAASMLIGAPESTAQTAAIDGPALTHTPWGEPDLRGTYSRAVGLPPAICGAHAARSTVLAPIHSGPTRIDQLPRHVRIRNPFGDARVILIGGVRSHARTEAGTWEGDTLVVHTGNLHALTPVDLFFAHSAPRGPARVTERFTRVTADLIDYRYTVYEGGAASWAIVFPLTRRTAEPHSLRPRPPFCGEDLN